MIDKIFNENCLDGMKRISDKSIDFVCTDLPFGITSCEWDKPIDLKNFWKEIKRIVKPQSSVALFASSKFSYELINSNPSWYKYKWIWVKNHSTFFVHAKNRPMSKYEEILIFSKGVINHKSLSPNTRMNYNPQGIVPCKPRLKNGAEQTPTQLRCKNTKTYICTQTGYPSDVLFFDTVHCSKKLNSTQKPTDLLEYLIKTYTNENDVVLDATIGSGSTIIAAINTNRHFIGFELDKQQFDIAQKRIDKALSQRRI